MWEKTATVKAAQVSASHLAEEGRRAAERSYRNNVPLLDELRKVAAANPDWSDNHIDQLVYSANTQRVRMQSKEMATNGSSNLLFDYEPVKSAQVRAGLMSSAVDTTYMPCDDYKRSPLSLFKERGDYSVDKVAHAEEPIVPSHHPLEPHFNRHGLWVDPEDGYKQAAQEAADDFRRKEYELTQSTHEYRSAKKACQDLLKEALWSGTSLDGVIDLLSYADAPEKTAQWLRDDIKAVTDESLEWRFMAQKSASVEMDGLVPNLDHPLLAAYNDRVLSLGKVAQAKRIADQSAEGLEYANVLAKAAEVWKEDKDKAQAMLDVVSDRISYSDSIKEGSILGGLARTGIGGAAGYYGAHAAGMPEYAWEGAALGAGIGAGFRGMKEQVRRANNQLAAQKQFVAQGNRGAMPKVTPMSNAYSTTRALTGAGLGIAGVQVGRGSSNAMERDLPVAHAYARNLQNQKPANWSKWSN